MPAVCFTEPELAQVGYTEAQAKEEGLDYKASKFPYAGNGRALSLDDTTGFVKLITLKKTILLSVHKLPVMALQISFLN